MRALWSGAVATLALLAAGQSQASTAFDAFQELCVKLDANDQAVLASADAAGWIVLPDQLGRQFANNKMAGVRGRINADKAATQILFVGTGSRAIGGLEFNMNLCAVFVMPGDANLRRELAEWVGIPRYVNESDATNDAYGYTEQAGVRSVVAENISEEDAKALVHQRRAKFLFSSEQDGMSSAAFAVPTI